ncbi:MAG: DUF6638 family protein [Pseudomonadota bacterium]
MERLIENKLIYGELFPVDQPHLVERYNRALTAFGHEPTGLMGFGIDAMGFSPEIAAEFEDDDYLNPFGTNPRFIILSPDQKRLPVVQTRFTSTADLMHEFLSANGEALRVLTLKDVVYGEIEDSTLQISSIDDLLSIKQVEFVVQTPDGLVEKAKRLTQLAGQFETKEDTWRDEATISEMLSLAQQCGDVRRNTMIPGRLHFENPSYWTDHLGGLYVFRDAEATTVLGQDEKPAFIGDDPVPNWYIPLTDDRTLYQFLETTGRLEPFNPTWLQASDVIDRRIDHYIRFEISRREPETDITALDDMGMRNWTNRNIGAFGDDRAFHMLQAVRKAVANRTDFAFRGIPPAMRLMVQRANPRHKDYALVNRLISEYVPFDFLVRFAVNKSAFYRDYGLYPEGFRTFVIDVMRALYLPDKDKFWNDHFVNWGRTDA